MSNPTDSSRSGRYPILQGGSILIVSIIVGIVGAVFVDLIRKVAKIRGRSENPLPPSHVSPNRTVLGSSHVRSSGRSVFVQLSCLNLPFGYSLKSLSPTEVIAQGPPEVLEIHYLFDIPPQQTLTSLSTPIPVYIKSKSGDFLTVSTETANEGDQLWTVKKRELGVEAVPVVMGPDTLTGNKASSDTKRVVWGKKPTIWNISFLTQNPYLCVLSDQKNWCVEPDPGLKSSSLGPAGQLLEMMPATLKAGGLLTENDMKIFIIEYVQG